MGADSVEKIVFKGQFQKYDLRVFPSFDGNLLGLDGLNL